MDGRGKTRESMNGPFFFFFFFEKRCKMGRRGTGGRGQRRKSSHLSFLLKKKKTLGLTFVFLLSIIKLFNFFRLFFMREDFSFSLSLKKLIDIDERRRKENLRNR